MKKIDLKKDLKRLYQPSAKEVAQVDVPAMNFLMIDGEGDPNTSPAYQAAVEALFSVAYAIKFKVKKTLAIDYGVPPLEGLWWADDMAAFTVEDKSGWKWTMMIMQPEFVNAAMVRDTIAEVQKEKGAPGAGQIAFRPLPRGQGRADPPRRPLHRRGPDRRQGARLHRLRAASAPASTTKSTSPTSARPTRPSGKRSSASRCATRTRAFQPSGPDIAG